VGVMISGQISKRITKLIICLVFSVAAFRVFAVSYVPEDKSPTIIKHISIYDDIARVRLETMASNQVENCNEQSWYVLDLNDPFAKEKYSTLLAAHATKRPVFLQLNGCHSNNMPLIRVIYFCDTVLCN
jgi:hypothetical protein